MTSPEYSSGFNPSELEPIEKPIDPETVFEALQDTSRCIELLEESEDTLSLQNRIRELRKTLMSSAVVFGGALITATIPYSTESINQALGRSIQIQPSHISPDTKEALRQSPRPDIAPPIPGKNVEVVIPTTDYTTLDLQTLPFSYMLNEIEDILAQSDLPDTIPHSIQDTSFRVFLEQSGILSQNESGHFVFSFEQVRETHFRITQIFPTLSPDQQLSYIEQSILTINPESSRDLEPISIIEEPIQELYQSLQESLESIDRDYPFPVHSPEFLQYLKDHGVLIMAENSCWIDMKRFDMLNHDISYLLPAMEASGEILWHFSHIHHLDRQQNRPSFDHERVASLTEILEPTNPQSFVPYEGSWEGPLSWTRWEINRHASERPQESLLEEESMRIQYTESTIPHLWEVYSQHKLQKLLESPLLAPQIHHIQDRLNQRGLTFELFILPFDASDRAAGLNFPSFRISSDTIQSRISLSPYRGLEYWVMMNELNESLMGVDDYLNTITPEYDIQPHINIREQRELQQLTLARDMIILRGHIHSNQSPSEPEFWQQIFDRAPTIAQQLNETYRRYHEDTNSYTNNPSLLENSQGHDYHELAERLSYYTFEITNLPFRVRYNEVTHGFEIHTASDLEHIPQSQQEDFAQKTGIPLQAVPAPDTLR